MAISSAFVVRGRSKVQSLFQSRRRVLLQMAEPMDIDGPETSPRGTKRKADDDLSVLVTAPRRIKASIYLLPIL